MCHLVRCEMLETRMEEASGTVERGMQQITAVEILGSFSGRCSFFSNGGWQFLVVKQRSEEINGWIEMRMCKAVSGNREMERSSAGE